MNIFGAKKSNINGRWGLVVKTRKLPLQTKNDSYLKLIILQKIG